MSIVLSDQEYTALVDKANDVREENNYLRAEIERLRRELQLAINHDRQPYPTVHAYETVCEALRKEKDKLERVRELCVSNKKHGIGVVGVDNLLEILDGEEGENE